MRLLESSFFGCLISGLIVKIACCMAFAEGSLGKKALIVVGRSGRILELLYELLILDGFFMSFRLK